MDLTDDRDTPLIAFDRRPSDVVGLSGFAAAETLIRRRHRRPAPDVLDRANR